MLRLASQITEFVIFKASITLGSLSLFRWALYAAEWSEAECPAVIEKTYRSPLVECQE